MADKRIFGVTALFNKPDKITSAAKKVKEAGFTKWDVHSPYPLHRMEKAMGLKRSIHIDCRG